MTCHGESCRQGRTICTEGCNEPCTPLIQDNHDWAHHDSAAEITARLPILILCTVLGCIAFSVSAWMLLGDSGITYALASLVRNLKNI